MKTFPLGLQDHLDSGATTLAWCWKVERRDGTILGFTDHDLDLSFDGVTFAAATLPVPLNSGASTFTPQRPSPRSASHRR